MVLCLRIELSVQVCCPPVLTNRLPEDVVGVDNFTYVIPLHIHLVTDGPRSGFGTYICYRHSGLSFQRKVARADEECCPLYLRFGKPLLCC